MQLHENCRNAVWPLWQKVLFRFCFILFGLYIVPFKWLSDLPVFNVIAKRYNVSVNGLVNFANAKFFHLKDVLVMPNGSGDTSYNWAELLSYCWLAIIGAIIWSLIDKKRSNYAKLNYFFCISIRYFLAFIAFQYGIYKVFALQMQFPNTSELATPIGDLLPMRFSWFFIGYSTPYQVFSGIMEVMVGLLLLFRRTATFGSIMALVVFTNVMMLNLSYDIPVKLFSMRLVALSLVLLLQDYHRILGFFVMNKETAICNMYVVIFPKKWMRITKLVLKCGFVLAVLGMITTTYGYYKALHKTVVFVKPIQQGLYNVTYKNLTNENNRWQNVVFDNQESGSFQTEDTTYKRLYGRAYFDYSVDTVHKNIEFRTQYKAIYLDYFEMRNGELLLSSTMGNDSIYMQLAKSNHHFQLAEKQFHWITEAIK